MILLLLLFWGLVSWRRKGEGERGKFTCATAGDDGDEILDGKEVFYIEGWGSHLAMGVGEGRGVFGMVCKALVRVENIKGG